MQPLLSGDGNLEIRHAVDCIPHGGGDHDIAWLPDFKSQSPRVAVSAGDCDTCYVCGLCMDIRPPDLKSQPSRSSIQPIG
jgi:hypothetical protein